MEELKQLLIEKWPDILSFLGLLLSYFLIYVYNNRVTIAKNAMNAIFKENTDNVTKETKEARKKIEKELASAKKAYEDAVSQIDDIKKQSEKTQRALRALLEEMEENNNGTEIFDDEGNTGAIG
jgi:peptidoglycan hydrolase CwlO-like protein